MTPALSGVRNIIESLWPILRASDDMIRIFGEQPMVVFRRPRNFKDDLVHSKLREEESSFTKGMRKCGKSRLTLNEVNQFTSLSVRHVRRYMWGVQ